MFSGVWTAFCVMCTWFRTRKQSGRSMKLAIYLRLLWTLRISGSISLLIIYVFPSQTGRTLLFLHNGNNYV
jgi:hypothetical protein